MEQLAEFVGNHWFLSLSFIAVLFLYLFTLMNEKSGPVKSITTDQLTRLVNQQNAKVIDVRSADAYKQGHIVNAINMPLDELKDGRAKLDKLKKSPVIAYCDHGHTSRQACRHLVAAGHDGVFNLSGGLRAWVNDKLPLSK